MRNQKGWLLAGVVVVLLVGCTEAPPAAPAVDLKAEETLLRNGEGTWNKDWNSKDIEKIVSHYASDATVMIPGMPAMKGLDAIRAGIKPFLTDPNLALTFASQTVEIAKGGDVAVAQGTYSITSTDPKTKKPVVEKGNYVTTYNKQADGSWKAVDDINAADGTH